VKALVYQGANTKQWTQVPDPVIRDNSDAIIQVDATTICGSDLHILKGDVPAVTPGRILGHEAVGTVTEIGTAVSSLKVGDRIVASCISGCGRCAYCRQGRYGQCLGGGGWILGHRIDGVQAEYARIPFADMSTYPLPAGISDEDALLVADILPTAYEVGVRNGHVEPGDTVVIVGAGPVGLAALLTARLYSPSNIIVVDMAVNRLQIAKELGAHTITTPDVDVHELVNAATGGLGADVVMEAVGSPVTFELCTTLVRAGGRVANIGVHGKPAVLHLEDLWIRDVTLTTGLVDTTTIPTLLRLLATGQLDVHHMVTHRMGLADVVEAYDIFARAADTGALKVVLTR